MIRLLQGDEGTKAGRPATSTFNDSSGGLAASAINLPNGSGEESLLVLGPSHPKMARFQNALKKHLEKQIYMTECDERDLVSLRSEKV
jgi:hypothetical protein